jgi:hypothetical protein
MLRSPASTSIVFSGRQRGEGVKSLRAGESAFLRTVASRQRDLSANNQSLTLVCNAPG